MKRNKRLIVLLGVLGVACAATYGVMKHEEEKELIKNSDEIILELDSETVTALSWEYDEEHLAFHKDENWYWDEDEAFPVNEEKIMDLLELFESFGVSFVIEEVEDYAQYGLDDPMCTITVQTEEETYNLQLGDYSTMDSERYVTLGDGNVYLVKKDPFDTFELTISDLILHDEMPDFNEAEEIIISGAAEARIFYEEDSTNTYGDFDVYFMEAGEEYLSLDTTIVNTYLRTIRNLDPRDYVTYHATEEEIQQYGMSSPELTIELTYAAEEETSETETFVLHVSRDPEHSDDAEEDITAYARVGESPIIYQISDDDYKALTANTYNDLRHKEVLTASFKKISQFDIELEDVSYTIMTNGNSEGRTYLYGEEELEIANFRSALTSLEVESFTDETPTEKMEIRLVVHLENENYPQVTVELYRYNGEFCLAVVDGKSFGLVERSQVMELTETVYDIVLQ